MRDAIDGCCLEEGRTGRGEDGGRKKEEKYKRKRRETNGGRRTKRIEEEMKERRRRRRISKSKGKKDTGARARDRRETRI